MKYWAYINNEIMGPYEKEELIKLPQFTNSTLLCPQSPVGEKTEEWKEAASFPEISALISNTSARNMSANPTDSGFNNPFHNFGNIEIKKIDENITAPQHSNSPGPLDPISLSQISKRQENFLNKEEPPKEEIKNDSENPSPAPLLSTGLEPNSPDSLKIDSPTPQIDSLSADKTHQSDISLAKASALSSEELKIENSLPELSPISEESKNQNIAQENQSSSLDISLPELAPLNPEIEKKEESLPEGVNISLSEAGEVLSKESDSDSHSPQSSEDKILKDNSLIKEDISVFSEEKIVSSQSVSASSVSQIPLEKIEEINKDTDKIISLIEKFVSNSAGKEDLSVLKSYLDSKIEILSNRINSFDAGEISSSLKSIENKLSSLEKKIESAPSLSKPSSLSPSSIQIEKNYDSAVIGGTEVPGAPKAPLSPSVKEEPKKQENPASPQTISEKKKIDFGPVLKTILKGILSAVLAAGIGIALSLALRSAGIIDLTVYMPFIPPAKKAENKGAPKSQPVSFDSSASSQTVSVSASSAPAAAQEKDLSEEVIYFVRTYIKEGSDKTIENKVIEHAEKNKFDSKSITWKARKMGEDMYQVFAEFANVKQPIFYLFEVDYKTKNIRPSNDMAGYIMEGDKGIEAPEDGKMKKVSASPKNKKTMPKKSSSSKKETEKQTPAKENKEVKPVKAEDKKAQTEEKKSQDEEYVYEYEDEGEEEYLMPGIPKK